MNELKVLASACILSGILRAGAGFIEYESAPESIEVLYMLIDIGFILGLIGFYTLYRTQLRAVGRLGFMVAIIGFSLIAGPESAIFGIGIYSIGSPVIGAGILLLSAELLRSRLCGFTAPLTWLGSVVIGAISMAVGSSALFVLSGILFGVGFVALGGNIWKSASLPSS